MLLLRQFMATGVFVLLAGFAGITIWKLLTGAMSLEGLLDSFDSGRRQRSPARLQLLIFTFAVAGEYFLAVLKNPSAETLPALPEGALTVLAGSQAIYLGGKVLSTYLPMFQRPK